MVSRLHQALHNVKWFFIYLFSAKARKARDEASKKNREDILDIISKLAGENQDCAKCSKKHTCDIYRLAHPEEKDVYEHVVEVPENRIEELLAANDRFRSERNSLNQFQLQKLLKELAPELSKDAEICINIDHETGKCFIKWNTLHLEEEEPCPSDEEDKPEDPPQDAEAPKTE